MKKLFVLMRQDFVILEMRFHHSKIVIEYLKSCNLEALFITAYTPREDPIEEFISMVKKSFREEYIISNNFSHMYHMNLNRNS